MCCVEVVYLDRDRAGGIGPRTAEILDLEDDSPDLPARVERPVERVGPDVARAALLSRARAELVAIVRDDSRHLARQVTREGETLGPGTLCDHRRRRGHRRNGGRAAGGG